MVMLYDKVKDGLFLMRAKALPALNNEETMEFQFAAPQTPSGKAINKTLGIRLMCDSYVGCDKQIEFDVKIKPRPEEVVEELQAEQVYNIPDDNIWETEGKWYYMYCDSFLEMVCTLILLFLMGVVLVQSKFGKKYIQPWIDWAWGYAAPYHDTYLGPQLTVVNEFLRDKGVDFDWMWDEELARQQAEAEAEEERIREEAERMQEEFDDQKRKSTD
eukprot:TRINITY_DN600_c0_g1_i1.p2 TRINITY_DN600_c0_g1~~TRINITY_DN600_c0_g1_i1.p2  ORF type:complete len:216 (-),score=62.27 TRINITY_DN600_c0_g1_i1:44-691(-)